MSIAKRAERDVEAGQRHRRRMPFQKARARRVGEPAGSAGGCFDSFEGDVAGCEVDAARARERLTQKITIGRGVRDLR